MTIKGTNKLIKFRRGFGDVQRLPGEQSSPQQHQASFKTSSILAGGSDHQAGKKCAEQTDKKY